MPTKLKKCFPMIREREELLAEIAENEDFRAKFACWEKAQQEAFLAICTGEKSPKEFHEYPEKYCHFFEQKSDTGIKLELLQKYVLIPLDIFIKYQHNRDVTGRRDAWLTLLSCDEPERIVELVEKYPEFRPIYEEGYELCRNTERVMEMFSKELYELDRNTVQRHVENCDKGHRGDNWS